MAFDLEIEVQNICQSILALQQICGSTLEWIRQLEYLENLMRQWQLEHKGDLNLNTGHRVTNLVNPNDLVLTGSPPNFNRTSANTADRNVSDHSPSPDWDEFLKNDVVEAAGGATQNAQLNRSRSPAQSVPPMELSSTPSQSNQDSNAAARASHYSERILDSLRSKPTLPLICRANQSAVESDGGPLVPAPSPTAESSPATSSPMKEREEESNNGLPELTLSPTPEPLSEFSSTSKQMEKEPSGNTPKTISSPVHSAEDREAGLFLSGSPSLEIPGTERTCGELLKLITEAKQTFSLIGIELPGHDMITKIEPHEVDTILNQFAPEECLSTSVVNPLISSFDWNAGTLVLHSSKIDVDSSGRCIPWAIPKSCTHIIIPCCHSNHWVLFYIDLHQRTIQYYNSMKSISLSPTLQSALQNGLTIYSGENSVWRFEESESFQQDNVFDCGLYTVMNAESLYSTPQRMEWHNRHSISLRYFYLEKLMEYASRSKHNLCFQKYVFNEKQPQRIKRSCPSDTQDYLISSKKLWKAWEPPTRAGDEGHPDWITARDDLTSQIEDASIGERANRQRAEHLLRMIDAIAGEGVLESWKTGPNLHNQERQGSSITSAAGAIYSLVNRGQSRSFRDTAILRVGKYLFASRILDRVNHLRSQGAPSKQRVATAGSSGEGNAVTRALKDFVREVHRDINQNDETNEVRKCKQWWNDGKIWKILADAIDPAILLLIPSGHKMINSYRIWDSDFVGLKSTERQPFVKHLIHLRPDLRGIIKTVEDQLTELSLTIAALMKRPTKGSIE